MKVAVTVLLLAFVVASLVYMAAGVRRDAAGAAAMTMSPEASVTETTSKTEGDGALNQDLPAVVHREPAEANAPSDAVETLPESTEVSRTVIAYYFHRTQRCRTCLTIEAYAQDALTEGLVGAVESGQIEWRAVNVEEPQHEHFVKEYDLYASALVLVDMEGGEVKQSKKLEQVWDLVGDESSFKAFVRDEALAYLQDGP